MNHSNKHSLLKPFSQIAVGLGVFSTAVLVAIQYLVAFVLVSRKQIFRPEALLYLAPSVIWLCIYSTLTAKTPSTHIGHRLQHIVKRLIDVIGSSTGLFFLGPTAIGIALAIKLDSPGPVLCRQQHIGQYGRLFDAYQFRTRSITPPDFPLTPIGRFLRRYSLDILPRIYNVIEGTMSLVGTCPRPPELENTLDEERQILTFRPGLTGLWVTSNALDSDLHQATNLDLEYIRKWSLLLDTKIALRTILTVIKGEHQ
jgi:lipopolysaccharide/colanic/teichoic acid biosynthesis glycosyltransferase